MQDDTIVMQEEPSIESPAAVPASEPAHEPKNEAAAVEAPGSIAEHAADADTDTASGSPSASGAALEIPVVPPASDSAGSAPEPTAPSVNVPPIEKVDGKEVVREVQVYDAEKAGEENRKLLLGSRMQALAARQQKREEKLERLTARVRARGRITNDEAQIVLGVSDRSAQRYLAMLMEAGKLKRVGGSRGRGVHYALP